LGAPRNLSAVREDLHDPARLAGSVRALHRALSCERIAAGDSAEQAAPYCKDPTRLPDPSTVRRWAQRRLLSLCCWIKVGARGQRFLQTPTILVSDLVAICRILPIEARSP
jgi:hypothetical protein